MTTQEFAPKDADTLKSEILAETGLEYEGNETVIDALVARGVKDETFKASLHTQKTERGNKLTKAQELLVKAGLDPETGEPANKDKGAGAPKEEQISTKDIIALTSAKISSDDYEEVIRLSKVLGKSIADTLQDKTAKTILAGRAEERATAEATNTGNSRQRNNQSNGDALLEKINSGEEVDDADISKAAKAAVAGLKAQKGRR